MGPPTSWALNPFYSSSVKQQQSHQTAVGPSALLLVERQKTTKPPNGLISSFQNNINTFFPESFFYSRFIFVQFSAIFIEYPSVQLNGSKLLFKLI